MSPTDRLYSDKSLYGKTILINPSKLETLLAYKHLCLLHCLVTKKAHEKDTHGLINLHTLHTVLMGKNTTQIVAPTPTAFKNG